MKKHIVSAVVFLLTLTLVSTASADSAWDESYREHFGFVIMVEDQVVAAILHRDWLLPEVGDEVLLTFTNVFVFSDQFANWLTSGEDTELTLVVERAQPGSVNRKVELEACTVEEYQSLVFNASTEYPGVLKFTFTVSPGYVKISV